MANIQALKSFCWLKHVSLDSKLEECFLRESNLSHRQPKGVRCHSLITLILPSSSRLDGTQISAIIQTAKTGSIGKREGKKGGGEGKRERQRQEMMFHIQLYNFMTDNIMLPIELTSILYSEWQGQLSTSSQDSQIYGKSLNGPCKVTFKNGNKYSGDFKNGMLHGKGKFEWADGISYTGEFKNNKLQGTGVYMWPDNSFYEGEVRDGLRHGFGKLTLEDCVYEGQWKDGQRDGIGKITFNNGGVYDGEFKNGLKHGRGKMYYQSGNYYEGQWKQDKKCGQGVMHWIDSRQKYTGQWLDNMQHGWGVHIWLDARGQGKFLRNRYEGRWKNGLRQGFGTFYYANGSKYEGYWVNNMKEGYAFFTNQLGMVQQTNFKNDRFVKEQDRIGDDSRDSTIRKTTKSNSVRPDIEPNPYSLMLNVSPYFIPFNPDLEQLYNYLLRNNSQLKSWYKGLASFYDNRSQYSFSLNLENVWKMIRSLKILGRISLASINRGFLGFKANIEKLLDISKQYDRKVALEDIYYFDQAFNYDKNAHSHYSKIVDDASKVNPLLPFNMHDGQRSVLLRDLIQILIYVSTLIDFNVKHPHKSIEKFINKIGPSLDSLCKTDKKTTEQNSQNFSAVSKTEKNVPQYAKNINARLFKTLTEESSAKYRRDTEDRTVTLKYIIKLLKDAGILNQTTDFPLIEKLLQKNMDSEYLVSGQQLPTDAKISTKLFKLANYELIEMEFIQLMFYCLVKKLPSTKDTEDNRQKYDELTRKIQQSHKKAHYDTLNYAHSYKNIRLQHSTKLPQKQKLMETRKWMQGIRERRAAKKRELQREAIENKLMELNDINIVLDTFDEEDNQGSEY